MKRTDLLSIVSPLPPSVGGHIMLEANGKIITATSSNESVSVSLSTAYDDKPFLICPSQEKLKAALIGLTGDVVKLAVGESLTVTAKGQRTVQCASRDSFPKVAGVKGNAVIIDGAGLKQAIMFVRGAAYAGIDKPMIAGVHINGRDVVASNGHSMRLIEIAESLPTVTLPSASAVLLARVIPDGEVEVRADERRIHLSWPSGSVITGLAPVGFPAVYRRLLSDWSGEALSFAADELSRAVSAVSAFTDGKTRPIYINCGKDVTLSCADAVEPLDMVSMKSAPRKILLAGVLLAEMLGAYGKEDVAVTLKPGDTDPLMFKDAAGRMGILLPMRQ